jgi:threonine dehydratase
MGRSCAPHRAERDLSRITGAEIYLKFENLQFTAAYKERGALNALLLLTEEQRSRGVIAASAGNHAQGLSYHGTRLGVPVTIVMPRTTPAVKIMQTESVGGNVVLEGETFDEAYARAPAEAERGLTFVHPFDDPAVAAGQGTVALEMLTDVPEIDMLAVPIGGGGLLTGMGTAARDEAGDRPGRRAGATVPVDVRQAQAPEPALRRRYPGRRDRGEGAGRSPRRFWKRWSTISCWSTKPR